ncbi:hypothetical protein K7432_010635 [Basidiobolus ranarum]|uniref:Carrier domain-containing protein n=1 Tax=Basidiobolus ranarum TaxID=34480 RepID=A0ABR2WNE3_9FUNG
MSRHSFSCIIVGGTTLTIECAKRLCAAGHIIEAVLPTDKLVTDWALNEKITCVGTVEELSTMLDERSADVLFSIVNPIILPESLLDRMSHAINYHDAPLPRYAGTHATSWALLELQNTYAITWHRIISKVDAGNVYVQYPVHISSTDNALSLNLKCYQAASKGFTELVENLALGTLRSCPQDLAKRSFYPRRRRPLGAGFLRWQLTAQNLSALVRALNFGDLHPNSLATPKLLLSNCIVRVLNLVVLEKRSESRPGTLLKIDSDGWHVATGSDTVSISAFTSLIGEPFEAQKLAQQLGLRTGDQLPMISDADAHILTETYEKLAERETFWVRRLQRFNSLHHPFVHDTSGTVRRWHATEWNIPNNLLKLPEVERVEFILSAFLIYLKRITEKRHLHLGWAPMITKSAMGNSLANVVPMEIEIDLQDCFNEVRAKVETECSLLKKNSTFPLDLIARRPELQDVSGLRSLRPWHIVIALVLDHTSDDINNIPAHTGTQSSQEAARGDHLTIQLCSKDGSFRWIYDPDVLNDALFDTRKDPTLTSVNNEIGHMPRFLKLLEALTNEPTIPIGGIDLLHTYERQQLLVNWNKTEREFPENQGIHQLFEKQSQRAPHAIALVYKDRSLSYRDLNTSANHIAHRLVELGIKPGDFIATMLERSMELVIAQLAVLKVGAAYVPIDPHAPVERQTSIILDCAARLLITDTHTNVSLTENMQLFRIPSCFKNSLDIPIANLDLFSPDLDVAYVMYTSGSTGTPNGALVPHRAIASLVINNGFTDIGPNDRVGFVCNPAFDATTFEMWAPLLNGGTLVVVDHYTVLTPNIFVQCLQRQKINVLFLTPALLVQMAEPLQPIFPQLKYLLFGGDIINPAVINNIIGNTPPQQLINGYGPTECTTFATFYTIPLHKEQSTSSIPIGRPLANKQIYLLDGAGQPVPLGATGELYIGGAGVARGYLNRPELTDERFLPDPFSKQEGARMYKTGDLARYLPDGNIQFLGRKDHQIKIRGFRIEPGEIEALLIRHPQVKEVVVLVMGKDSSKHLVAYIVAEPREKLLISALRDLIAANLPDYMLPAAFVRLNTLPLTSNGKVDRKALPAPDREDFTQKSYEAPQGEIEATLTKIWTELINLDEIGRHDNFFSLGGNSLLAVQMIERLSRLNLKISIRTLFEKPTLCELAQTLQRREVVIPPRLIKPGIEKITPDLLSLVNLSQTEIDYITEVIPGGVANIQDIYGLTPLQDGILFHHLLAAKGDPYKGDPYLVITQMTFENRKLLDKYLNIIQRIVDRHDILRTAFIWKNISTPVQVVCRQASLAVTEYTFNPANGPISEQLLEKYDPCYYRTDITKAPLLSYAITQESNGRWSLLQLLHHLIGDHSTVDVMQSEVEAFFNNRESDLPTAQHFRNLVAQSRTGLSNQEHEKFFSDMLGDVDAPTLPFGLSDVYCDGSQVTEAHQMLSQELNERLRFQAKTLGVTLASLFHLAWAQVLACASDQERVVFGTVLFGRMHAGEGADKAMGLFINTLPFRVDVNERGVLETVLHTHKCLAMLLEHEHASLSIAQRCAALPAGVPLFSTLLNYRHNATTLGVGSTVPGVEILSTQERSNYSILLSVEDFGDSLGLTAQIVYPHDPARVCDYMQKALQSLVDTLQHSPNAPVSQLEILPNEERKTLIETMNETASPYPDLLCIHHLFEDIVERAPHAAAVTYEDCVFSYAELNARANRLAHELIDMGVQPDMYIAVCMARSPAIVVTFLAVLKAGGAVIPLDPVYPSERLGYILADVKPVILIADEIGRRAIGNDTLASLTVLDLDRTLNSSTTNPKVETLTAKHLAYVIYTSGSTGMPKGIMMEHKSIVNLIMAPSAGFEIQPSSRVLQFASFSFDVSIWEILLTLSRGANLYIPTDMVRQDRDELWKYLEINGITHAILPPALLQDGRNLQSLSKPLSLILTGEAPNSTLIQNMIHQGVIYNAYGPTETHVATIWTSECNTLTNGKVSIGRPIANARIYLLNKQGQPVPLGAIGELYIGGVGVARGYLNRPELTAEKFISDHFCPLEGSIMYKTGDLARYLPDGNIEFLGRNDFQIKIRGFRIEPGEIETLLMKHPQVRESIVLALDKDGDKRLIAYITAEFDEQLSSKLRVHLESKLPGYMIPSAFVRLETFPMTSNGKLDRRALPEPDEGDFVHQIYEAPKGEIEEALSQIWAETLNLDVVGRCDNFFALGGYSLLAVKMLNRIRTMLGVEIALHTLFEAPTVAKLAQRLLEKDTNHQRNSFSVMLPLNTQGSRAPLFCIHAVSGLSWGYIGLSKHLGPDQPIYGLQARGLNNETPVAKTMDDMISDYIQQIRKVQSNGPYHLLGWSLGVYIAHSIATRLKEQGEKVALLALLDINPEYSPPNYETEADRDSWYIRFLDRYCDEGDPNAGEYLWEKTHNVIKNNLEILKGFTPPVYSDNAIFFRATKVEHRSIPLVSPDLWKPYILGDIEIFDINCTHRDMDRPLPMAEIGRTLARKFNELQKQI